jgi:hypothetical protein
MDSDRINIANKIIKYQSELIDNFDEWVRAIRAKNMEKAAGLVKQSLLLRNEITKLKTQYEKLNKRSGIILLKN